MENQLLEEHNRICKEIDALGDYSNAKYSSEEYEEKKRQADNLEEQRKNIFNKIMELRRTRDGKKKNKSKTKSKRRIKSDGKAKSKKFKTKSKSRRR